MTSRLERWLEARWYGGVRPGPVLEGLATMFGGVVRWRRQAYRRGWLTSEHLPVPVVVVGNLAVGGAGKTPMTIALVEALRARGWRPGVISRGYGGSERGPARLGSQPDPQRFGDEPCLIARRTGAPVAVARRRAEAGRLLVDSGDVDLLVADDGLQHYALQRDVELLLIDGRRRLGNGRMLPAGPMREPQARAAECSLRVVTGGVPFAGEWAMELALADPEPLGGGPARPLATFGDEPQPVRAVAGIADPGRFFDALRAAGVAVIAHPFPDHHPFVPADFGFDDGRPLLMTEKDAVKCAAFAQSNWYAVPACGRLPDAFFDTLSAMLTNSRQPA